MAGRKRGSRGQPGNDPVADLLAAHGGDVNALMRTLVMVSTAEHMPGAQRARFTPRRRPKAPVRFVLRVDIDGARPPIWRRLDLAGDLTLDRVDRAIQWVFGWEDMHLHAFTPQVAGYRDGAAPSFDNPGLAQPETYLPEHEVRLDQVVARVGDRLFYEYDFGDSWRHVLKVEDVRPRGDGPAAQCLGGRRAAPMEDCGGIWRYNEIAAAFAGRQTSLDADDLAEIREWHGGPFDPANIGLSVPQDLDGVVFGAGGVVSQWFGVPVEPGTAHDDDDPEPVGTGARPASPLLDNPRLAPALADLAERAEIGDQLGALEDLVAAADIDVTSEPVGVPRSTVFAGLTREEAHASTQEWRDLIQRLGPMGVRLLADGSVTLEGRGGQGSLFAPAGEHNTPPTESVRADLVPAAVSLKLIRKRGDHLLATRTGADVIADPVRLWRHLADHLPAGAHPAGGPVSAFALLVIATGRPARETFAALLPDVAAYLGRGQPVTAMSADTAFADSATVWTVMDALAGFGPDGAATEPARRLARAALLRS